MNVLYQGILIQNPCPQKFTTNTTQHTIKQLHYSTPTTMSNARKMMMNLGKLQSNKYGKSKKPAARREIPETRNEDAILPPSFVETVVSSSQSLTSSIGIGEFGMNAARRGNAAAFSMAVKDSLFPRMKFLQGTNASLDFSMETTSICGYLRVCCGVSDADASQWWDDHRMMLKNIHTDCRNNKIKMIKQQFNGKTRYSQLMICQTPCILLTLLLLKSLD
ncbi:MAG: hypothetical protein MZV65_38680 [Chromatiales bacterium]|nr:hypothetical protein [Chromatiales bacterium]